MRYDMVIPENIGFGKIESAADEARIQSAAYRSLAKNVIDRLPNGYDQMVVRMADRILVLADGAVREQGNHEESVALGGRYAELFELQATGYK